MSYFKAAGLMLIIHLAFAAMGWFIAGKEGALIGTLIALAFHIVVFWYAEKIMLKLHNAREVGSDDASPMIRAFVADCDRLAMRANMPRPRTYIVDAFQPNAFVAGRDTNHASIAVTDGLKGMAEALGSVFPATTLQTCIVHLIRNSLDYASWKDRKALAAAIKPVYTAPSAEGALAELDAFEEGPWGKKFPTVVAAWRRAWDKVIPFFAFPAHIRRVIYTTNAIESVNARLRKIIKTRGHFPTDDAATKLIWLALRNITADWDRAGRDWKEAMNQFAILYDDRFTKQFN